MKLATTSTRLQLTKRILFFVKFFEREQYANDFVAGRVFCNRLSVFKQRDSTDISGRNDTDEGTFLWGQPGRGHLVINDRDISKDLAAPVQMQKNWVDDLHLFCAYTVRTRDLNLDSRSSISTLRKQLVIRDECLMLGNYAVVVWNVREFVWRMRLAARKKRNPITCKGVRYYDPNTFHGQFGDIESVFRKQSSYAFQQEFRFVIDSMSTGIQPLTMNIGGLKRISSRYLSLQLRGEGWFDTIPRKYLA